MGSGKTHDHDNVRVAQRPAKALARAVAAHEPPALAVMQRAAIDPHSLTAADVAQLQRTIGNAAVGRLLGGTVPGGNRTGLPDQLKAGIEHLSGLAMDDVRVHYNSSKPAEVEALAYTKGTDIHVAPGQERHVPHEAWHVVQQMQGRVPATAQVNGVAINDDAGLEHDADVMGSRAKDVVTLPTEQARNAGDATSLMAKGPLQRHDAEEEPAQRQPVEEEEPLQG